MLSVTVGWLLFMVFCGAGLVALPLDMIREFLGRPRACITKSEYMTRAKALGNKAKGIMVLPPTMSLLLNSVVIGDANANPNANAIPLLLCIPVHAMRRHVDLYQRCRALSGNVSKQPSGKPEGLKIASMLRHHHRKQLQAHAASRGCSS